MSESWRSWGLGGCFVACRWALYCSSTYLGLVVVFWFLETQPGVPPHLRMKKCLENLTHLIHAKPDAGFERRQHDSRTVGSANITRWLTRILVCNGNGGVTSRTVRGARGELPGTTGAGVLLFDYPGYRKSSGFADRRRLLRRRRSRL